MAVPTKALLETVDQIYQAGCDPTHWPEVIANCQRLFPGTGFSLFVSVGGVGHDPISTTSGWDPDWIKQYFEHFHKLNPFNDLLRSKVGQVVRESQLVSRDWLERHAFYQEWLKPAGNYTHGTNLTLARECGSLARLSIDIPDCLSHLEAPSAEFLQSVGLHFVRAFALSSRLHVARVAEAGLQGLLDRISGAAFLVRQGRKIVAVNRRAAALLEQGRFVRISPTSELTFNEHQIDEMLCHALQSALSPAEKVYPSSFTVNNGCSRPSSVLVLPFRTSRTLATAGAEHGYALVLISAPRRVPVPPSEMLKNLYGMSQAEANVVLSITEGDSLQTTADRLGICRTTARNQLAAAMAKLGVHRQAELVGAVAALAPCLDLGPGE